LAYELNSAATVVQELPVGETLTDTITILSADGTPYGVTVTIQGSNDAPVVVIGDSVVSGNLAEDAVTSASGQVAVSDVDLGATQTFSAIETTGSFGTFSVDASTGAWTYDLDSASSQALGAGESVTEIFTVMVDDGQGGSTTQDITLTVTGDNDGPVIQSDAASRDLVENQENPTASGQIVATDADFSAQLTYSGSGNGSYGAFSIDPSTGEWNYTMDPDAADRLAAGETVIETFTVAVTDDKLAVATQTVTINITGANDGPLVSDESTTSDWVWEDTRLTASGQVVGTDIDNNEVLTYSGSAEGSYGTFTVDASTGAWTYDLNNDAVQNFNAVSGEDEVFTVTVTDSSGASVTQNVTVEVDGRNDAAQISGKSTGLVREDVGPTVTTGNLTVTDADDFNYSEAYFEADQGDGMYGAWSIDSEGNWSYTIDNANSSVQDLNFGQSLIDSFEVYSADGTPRTIEVTIQGEYEKVAGTSANNTLSGGARGDELLGLGGNDTLTGNGGNDRIDGGTGTDTAVFTGQWSDYQISLDSATGTYTLTGKAGTAGEADGTDTTIRVERFKFGGADAVDAAMILNDGPVAEADSASVIEAGDYDAGVDSVSGNVTDNDTDADASLGDTKTVVAVGTSGADSSSDNVGTTLIGTYGSLRLDANGQWDYSLNNESAATQELTQDQVAYDAFTYTVVDANGATSTSTLTITVTGTNDVPSISGTVVGA